MTTRHFSRREFFKGVIGAGVGLLAAPAFNEMFNVSGQVGPAATANPIKVGIIDPLTGPYKTSSIHDVHGANVAMDWFNSRGGVLGRPVVLLEADDASQRDNAIKAATKLIKEDSVDPPPLTHLLLPRCYHNRAIQDYPGNLSAMPIGCFLWR